MNKQRKEVMEKKKKEALNLKLTVEESIAKFKEIEKLRQEEQLRKK